MLWVGLQFVIVVFPDHIHLHFEMKVMHLHKIWVSQISLFFVK